MDIEALATLIAIIRRDWGHNYGISEVIPSFLGGGTVKVHSQGDGSVFYMVASHQGDRWGYGDTIDAAWDSLLAKVAA